MVLLKRGNSGQLIFAVTFSASLLAHVWAAASLLQHPQTAGLGSIDVATDAISVNLEATDVIDATESAASKAAASSPAGATVEGAKEAKEKPDDVKDEELKQPTEIEAEKPQPQEQSRTAEQADAERQRLEEEAETQKKIKEQAEREETKRHAEAEAEEAEKKKKEKAQQAAAAGGAGTTGSDESQDSRGRVSASQGSVINYGANLRAIISSNTPRNIRKTSVRVSFRVAPAGGLTALDVVTSSKDAKVDKRILDLIRDLSSRFPPPPSGATADQLSYNIEIIFQ